jgi:transposase
VVAPSILTNQQVQAWVNACKNCGLPLSANDQVLLERYEKIELPPIRPVVTQVERYGCTCPNCGELQQAPVPVGLEPGSPFGSSIAAVATMLRYGHAISYSRLSQLFGDLFHLDISEGALCNLFERVKTQLEPSIAAIVQRLHSSRLVGSDETSARLNGKTVWEWVFQNAEVCLHVIRPSRGAQVIQEVMGDHRPEIWVSDLFSAQKQNPALLWQVCLAHQLRNCQYGIDAGDTIFSPVMKRLFLRAIAWSRRWETLSLTTQAQYRCRLERQLTAALDLSPTQEDAIRLQKRYWNIREHLFLFLEDTTIPPTNNASEQALRMSVIFRKVTHGFRSDWGAELFANIRSIINTGKRQGLSALQAIAAALNPLQPFFSLG